MRKRLSVFVLEDTMEGLKSAAKARDLSMGRLVDRAVYFFLKRKDNPSWPPKPRRAGTKRSGRAKPDASDSAA
jgi:hypothetical protein